MTKSMTKENTKQASKLEEANNIVSEDYKFGFHTDAKTVVDTGKGLSREVVAKISELKHEPEWMKDIRLKAYDEFVKQPLPSFGPDLTNLDYGDYTYFIRTSEGVSNEWDKVPEAIKDTFQKLGIPEQEKKYLAGVSTQFESEVVYHNTQVELQKQGVLFCDTDTALKEYPEIVKKYFGHLVPASDNKFAALNTAVWSGGSFIYVPKGVKLQKPLQSYFRINAERMGQFERTLIIVEDEADLNYVEGCTAPIWSKDSLHAAIVEIFIGKHAKCRYSTVQNWSNNIVNLVTKRAICDDYGRMEWIDGNVGSELNMKYPSCILKGKGSQGYTVSIAFAGKGQYQDTGSRMIHIGEGSVSTIISKSICRGGGVANYRGKVDIKPKAVNCKSHVECDTLILDDISTSDTIPMNCVGNDSSRIEHEATVSKISDTELFYLMSRGISEADAMQMIVMGFIEPFARELPVEYAVELNQLIKLSMKEEKDPRLETKACGSV